MLSARAVCASMQRADLEQLQNVQQQQQESSNTRLKPRLEGKQRSIIIIIITINVDDTVVLTKPNQPLPLLDLCIVNNSHTHF